MSKPTNEQDDADVTHARETTDGRVHARCRAGWNPPNDRRPIPDTAVCVTRRADLVTCRYCLKLRAKVTA